MRRRTIILASAAGVGVAAAAAMAFTVSMLASPALPAAPAATHTFLHIGCTHHNHGPKWHAGHGRAALGDRRSRARETLDDPDDLASRSLTSGR